MISTIITFILLFLKPMLLAYIFTRFEPINQPLVNMLERVENKKVRTKFVKIVNAVLMLLTCSKCLTFWIALIMTGNIYIAIICFIFMKYYESSLSQWEHTIKF